MSDPVCIWCGRPCAGAASFLFLASRGGEFVVGRPGDGWADQDEVTLEGHQFFCHATCFKDSVPEAQQYGLRLALDEVD